MTEMDKVLVPIEMSMKSYQVLQNCRLQAEPEMSIQEFVELMALKGAIISSIQNTQEGVVLFEGVEGEQTLIDQKSAEELSNMRNNLSFFPPRTD